MGLGILFGYCGGYNDPKAGTVVDPANGHTLAGGCSIRSSGNFVVGSERLGSKYGALHVDYTSYIYEMLAYFGGNRVFNRI